MSAPELPGCSGNGASSGGRILCAGGAHWDIIARAGRLLHAGDDVPGLVEQRPGGVALNVALGLAARGAPAHLCAVVGADAAGASLVDHARTAGVDCTGVIHVDGAETSRYVAVEDNDGSLFAAVAEAALTETHAAGVADQAALAMHAVDAVFIDANLTEPAIMAIAARAVEMGVDVIANPVSAAKAPRLVGLLSGSYHPTIIANLQEANMLVHGAHGNAAAAAEELRGNGAGTALVTDGGRPAALATQSGTVTATPATLAGRISVTGAGDALLAAFLASGHRRDNPGAALASALQAAAEQMTVRS